jgi:hypothetical protein
MKKCVGPLGAVPTQMVNGGGHHAKPVRGPTQMDQIIPECVRRAIRDALRSLKLEFDQPATKL